jgi:hypothetical protein
MKRINDKYIALYLEQLDDLRKRNVGEWMQEEPWWLALEEIRARRALDLTDDDQASVLFAREMLRKATYGTQHARDEVAKCIIALDKVLARGGGR